MEDGEAEVLAAGVVVSVVEVAVAWEEEAEVSPELVPLLALRVVPGEEVLLRSAVLRPVGDRMWEGEGIVLPFSLVRGIGLQSSPGRETVRRFNPGQAVPTWEGTGIRDRVPRNFRGELRDQVSVTTSAITSADDRGATTARPPRCRDLAKGERGTDFPMEGRTYRTEWPTDHRREKIVAIS